MLSGEDLVPEPSLQVQEDHEAGGHSPGAPSPMPRGTRAAQPAPHVLRPLSHSPAPAHASPALSRTLRQRPATAPAAAAAAAFSSWGDAPTVRNATRVGAPRERGVCPRGGAPRQHPPGSPSSVRVHEPAPAVVVGHAAAHAADVQLVHDALRVVVYARRAARAHEQCLLTSLVLRVVLVMELK